MTVETFPSIYPALLRRRAEEIARLRQLVRHELEQLRQECVIAHEAGDCPVETLAEAAGISRARFYQLLEREPFVEGLLLGEDD